MFCSLHTESEHEWLVEEWVGDKRPTLATAITPMGRELLRAKFLLFGERPEDRLAHACVAYASDRAHARRLASYISKGWFMFATPLLANAGTNRGLPISCFLNYVPDSRQGLANHYAENIWLSTLGGGIGAHWSDVRSKGEETSAGSETTGIIPFMKVADSQVRAFRQGKTRQGAYATYLSISHPEIMEYIRMRSADGGDTTRKCFDTHVGVNITDAFMKAVQAGEDWVLRDPHSGAAMEILSARSLWASILKLRMTDRGEPYLFFIDTANEYSPYLGNDIKGSNLCTEITLRTDSQRTAVCCLSSVNVRKFDEWVNDERFIADLVLMLDNVLDVFIQQAPPTLHRAVRSAREERSLGLGAMGVVSYLQHKMLPIGSDTHIFEHINKQAHHASVDLAKQIGAPTLTNSSRLGIAPRRNLHLTAIAPNATSSLMLGVSPGIEPYLANYFTQVQGATMSSNKNPELEALAVSKGLDVDAMWADVAKHGGSIQSLDYFTEEEKNVFRTFEEINQLELVAAASRRQVYIDQAQSFNVCFSPSADPKHVNEVHLAAWAGVEGGDPLKSMYYLIPQVTDKVETTASQAVRSEDAACSIDNKDECLACQG